MTGDVKARAVEWLVGELAVLDCHKLASTKWKAERLADALAEAGLLVSSVSEWEPLGRILCSNREVNEHWNLHDERADCVNPRAVAVEAAAPAPRYTASEDNGGAGYWTVYDDGRWLNSFHPGYPGGAQAAAEAEAARLNALAGQAAILDELIELQEGADDE